MTDDEKAIREAIFREFDGAVATNVKTYRLLFKDVPDALEEAIKRLEERVRKGREP
jgi:hypothetical protein